MCSCVNIGGELLLTARLQDAAVGKEPVTFSLQVGRTPTLSSCTSAAPQLKSGSDVPADDSSGDSRSGRASVCV